MKSNLKAHHAMKLDALVLQYKLSERQKQALESLLIEKEIYHSRL